MRTTLATALAHGCTDLLWSHILDASLVYDLIHNGYGGGTEFGAYDKGRAEGTTRDDPGTTQNCPKLLSGPNEKMPLNSRTCQPDRCREGGPRHGAKGKDRDARGRQGGMNRGGRERVPPQR